MGANFYPKQTNCAKRINALSYRFSTYLSAIAHKSKNVTFSSKSGLFLKKQADTKCSTRPAADKKYMSFKLCAMDMIHSLSMSVVLYF